MPQRSVYIREEDDDKWLALDNKAEFVHNALNGGEVITRFERGKEPEVFTPKPPNPETGYPCCLNERKPCKHWTFDGTLGLWANSLTGKTREAV